MQASEVTATDNRATWIEHLQLPQHYGLLVFVACLDILGTWLILALGGSEVNHLADAILSTFGFNGMVVYKFALIALVVVICEEVTRRRRETGLKLATVAVGISLLPVMFAGGQLFARVLYGA